MCCTKKHNATLDASRIVENIDSPKNAAQIATPYNPPTNDSFFHDSTLCAYPNRCNSQYAEIISSEIHVSLLVAQERITCSNEVSMRMSKIYFFIVCRRLLETLNASRGKIARGSGAYHTISSLFPSAIGNTPIEYALSRSSGESLFGVFLGDNFE